MEEEFRLHQESRNILRFFWFAGRGVQGGTRPSPAVAQTGYRTAGIPNELAQEIEDAIKMNSWLGVRTLSSFVADASRRRIVEIYRLSELRERVRERARQAGIDLSDDAATELAEAELAEEA